MSFDCDKSLVERILHSLISNAYKFSHNGNIIVRVSLVESKPRQKEDFSKSSVTLRFSIEDNGIGVSKPAQKNLFEAFVQGDDSTTREHGGIGLGLSICKQLVELLKGRIGLESDPGMGSIFWFEIPFRVNHKASKTIQKLSPVLRSDDCLIIIEENPVYMDILSEYGRRSEATVVQISNSQEFATFIEDVEDMIYKGVCLASESFSGTSELLKRTQDPGIFDQLYPVVMGWPPSSQRKHVSNAGEAINYICKPLTESEFRETLINALSKKENLQLQPVCNPLKVLVADDDDVARLVMEGMLTRLKQPFVSVKNGQEAVNTVLKSSKAFDLIFMDCDMPVMDGLTATKQIRIVESEENLGRSKIIAVTAHALEEQKERCEEVGMDSFVPKPIRMEQVKEELVACSIQFKSSRIPPDHAGP